ncbi:hypothetical protein Tco_0191129 [Tanacetum coccineum]
MEGVDRLNELKDEMLVNNIMSRLDCTTKEVIKATAIISTRWKNLWTSLPRLIFSDVSDLTDFELEETDLHGYISFIDNTLNQCPTNPNLKKFKLDTRYSSQGFTFEDELFFNTSCITRMTLSFCRFNPPNGAISWERLECLCLFCVTLRIDITSESVKKLVFSGYNSNHGINPYKEDYIDCIKINAPYISSLLIKDKLFLWELVLLDVSSLTKVNLDYSFDRRKSDITRKEIFRRLLESLYHVKDVIISDYCWECGDNRQLMLDKKLLTLHRASPVAEIELC